MVFQDVTVQRIFKLNRDQAGDINRIWMSRGISRGRSSRGLPAVNRCLYNTAPCSSLLTINMVQYHYQSNFSIPMCNGVNAATRVYSYVHC